MKHFITFETKLEPGEFVLPLAQTYEVDVEIFNKIINMVTPKEKKAKKPVLPYYVGEDIDDLNDEEINEIFTEDDELDDPVMLERILKDSDCLRWEDRDCGRDDKPTRLWINNRYLIEFTVGSGQCIEATWESTIWRGEAIDLKLIEVKNEKKL